MAAARRNGVGIIGNDDFLGILSQRRCPSDGCFVDVCVNARRCTEQVALATRGGYWRDGARDTFGDGKPQCGDQTRYSYM